MIKLILFKLVFENEIVFGIEFFDVNMLFVLLFISCYEVIVFWVVEVLIICIVFIVVFKCLMLIFFVVLFGD